jgi:hypothetical protein
MIHRGRRYSRGLIDESKVTSDPALRAGIESGMKRESEAVYRVDVVPMGLS